jgi:protein-histidine pros-kinase
MDEPLGGRQLRLAALLVDETSDGLIATGSDGRVLFWNDGARARYGYTAAETLDRPLLDLLVPVEGREEAARQLETALARGHTQYRAPRLRRDGSALDVAISIRRRFLDDGSPVLVIRHRPAASGEGEVKFRRLLEAAPDAIVVVDSGGRIRIVNAQTERLFGYRREQLIGEPIEMLMPERFRAAHAGQRHRYAGAPHSRGMNAGLQLLGLRCDGTEFPIDVSLAPLDTEEGLLISSAIRDITEQKRLERRLEEASRQKSEFLADMSHELRTPLNAIVGFSELMYDGKVGPIADEHREYLGDILTSARHLLQLINDILDLAKVEAGKIEFQPSPVDIGAIAREVCETMRGLASNKHLDIGIHVDPSAATASIDPGRLRQILYNYVSNAIKFTPDGGRVEVRVSPDGEAAFRIDVIDTGVGIAPEHIDRLFVEFQQLDASTGKEYQGTGLGLALTRRLAEAQGGRVGVRSTPGTGSVFSVTLPRSPSHGRAGEAEPGAPTEAPVLVVDDDGTAFRLVAAALRESGLPMLAARSAEQGLHAVARRPPAVVVVDLLMPGSDGFAFISSLRSTQAGARVPIVVWTIKDLSEDERRRLESADALVVSKRQGGVEPLVAAIGRVLGKRLVRCAMAGEAILVVDDQPQNLKLARVLLELCGYEVRTARHAGEALEVLGWFAPRLILMDVQLPGMDGLELTRRLKADPLRRHIAIVALTAYAMKGDEERLMAAGCDGYIAKPIDTHSFPRLVEQFLTRGGRAPRS